MQLLDNFNTAACDANYDVIDQVVVIASGYRIILIMCQFHNYV